MTLDTIGLWIVLALLIGFFLLGVLIGATFGREKYIRHRYEFSFSLKELSTLITLSLPLIELITNKICTSCQSDCISPDEKKENGASFQDDYKQHPGASHESKKGEQ